MNLEQRLRESLVAPDPGASFTARVMARVMRGRSRRRSRLVLAGAVMAVAAAAAMMAWRLVQVQPSLPQSAAMPTMRTATDAEPDAGPPVMPSPSIAVDSPAGDSTAESAPPALPPAAIPQYSVLVMPLRHQTQDRTGRGQVEAFYSSMIEEMRKVPGLTLQVPGGSADHMLTVTSLATYDSPTGNLRLRSSDGTQTYAASGSGAGYNRDYVIDPHTGKLRPGETRSFEAAGSSGTGSVAWLEVKVETRGAPSVWYTFAVGSEGPVDLLVARQLEKMRMQVFPPDAALQQRIVARLGDAGLTQAEQLQVLEVLLVHQGQDPPMPQGQPQSVTQGSGPRLDPATLRALTRHAPHLPPSVRAQIWTMLRGVRYPELVQPLVHSLHRDTDQQVRLAALHTLTANFAAEPAVREAMATAAQQDADDAVRIAARRELHGPAQWRSDVLEVLDNADLSYASRLAPLRASGMPGSRAEDLQNLLHDRQVLQKLVDLVRRNLGDPAQSRVNREALVLLSNARDPLVADLFSEVRLQGIQSPVLGFGASQAGGFSSSGSGQPPDAPFVPSALLDRMREVTEAVTPPAQQGQ